MIGGVANCYVPNAKLLYRCLIISATPFASSFHSVCVVVVTASIHVPSVILEQHLGGGG
jgi:hypothetical protein